MTEGPYKLPEGWRWARLGEVCEINPRRPLLSRSSDAPTSFVPMSAVDDVTGTIVQAEVRPFAQVRKGYTYFQEGDVLFAKITPCMENGKSAVATGLIDGLGFGSTEFHVLRPSGDVAPEWVWLFVRREDFRKAAKAAFRGGVGQQRVPGEFLQEALVPLPPLAKQRRIVARIEELMSRVREAKRLRQQAKEDAERLWQSVLAETFPRPGSELPPGWRWVRLGEVAFKPQYGYTASAVTDAVGPKFLRITDITSGGIDWHKVPYCAADEKTLGKYKLSVGDVLFARSGSVGATILIREPLPEAVFASYLIRVRLQEEVDPEYAEWLLKAPVAQRQLIPQGAAQKNINARHIERLLIPLPPLDEQRRIVAHLEVAQEKIRALKEAQAETDEELKRLEQAVLDKAFRGEL